MIVFWAVAAGVFLLVEGLTAALCSIWFAVGSAASLIAAALHAPLWLQIVLFLVVSGVCFWLLYPRLKKSVQRRRQSTNADMVLGQTCLVTERIDNLAGAGTVKIGGKTWSARASDRCTIEAGTLVRIEQIQGVKLIVRPLETETKS